VIKIHYFFLLLVLLLVLFQINIYTEEYYPAKTIFIEPSFLSKLIFPLSSSNLQSGGGIQLGIDLVEVLENVGFGIFGGYNYLPNSEGVLSNFSNFGIRGGYNFYPANIFRINPIIGISVQVPLILSADSTIFELSTGFSLGFHLFNRNFLVLTSLLSLPFGETLNPNFSIQLGIKRSHPVKIELPPVELSLNVVPDIFSPDGDGENDLMEIDLEIKNVKSVEKWQISIFDYKLNLVNFWAGTGIPPENTEWSGYSYTDELIASASDYGVIVNLQDFLGNETIATKYFLTDILVENENGKYKIKINSIIFPPNSADISLLSKEEQDENQDIIKKIATKLQKFNDYNIRIEGHGNIDSWKNEVLAEKEQIEVLIPLTEKRAMAIKDALIAAGMDEKRISVLGVGGSSPIIPFSDEQNRWKNRRVEFILLK
jgi:outer membrane protein OmpA-like peptidoglycan-associated protein